MPAKRVVNWSAGGSSIFSVAFSRASFGLALSVVGLPATIHQSDSLRRRANARNVSFRISLRWTIHIINPVDKTKLSFNNRGFFVLKNIVYLLTRSDSNCLFAQTFFYV